MSKSLRAKTPNNRLCGEQHPLPKSALRSERSQNAVLKGSFQQMSQTIIGRLILALSTKGLGEANKVAGTLGKIERAAKQLNSTKMASWGTTFQRNIDKLKLTPREINDITSSWARLQEAIKKKQFGATLPASSVAQWKNQTLQHYAAQRAAFDNHARVMEAKTRTHAKRLRSLMKPAFVAGGFYTTAYGGGMAIRGGLRAASEATRTKYRMQLANIPAADQRSMESEAQRLSTKYGPIDEQDVLELNKTLWALFGGNMKEAQGALEKIVQTFIMDVTAVGVDRAGENLNSLLKGMDVANRNEGADGGVARIGDIVEGWVRAKQVEGKDIDLGRFLEFSRTSKGAKYGLSDEFYAYYLTALGQDLGFGKLGHALSGGITSFLSPVGTGKFGRYKKEQAKLGIRDQNDSLIERDLFVANPYEWVHRVLVPLLQKNGIDTKNKAAITEAVSRLTPNSNLRDAMTGFIAAKDQIEKNIRLYRSAAGTSAATDVRYRDPFAASESLLAAMRNLSAATLPMEHIAGGLNAMADGVNALAAAAKENPLATTIGLGAAGYGTYKGGKWIGGKLSDAFGLKSSALALDGSAAALTRAAAALQGGVVHGANNGKHGKTGISGKLGAGLTLGSLFGLGGRVVPWVGAGLLAWEFIVPDVIKAQTEKGWDAHLERHKKQIAERDRILQNRIDHYSNKGAITEGPRRRHSHGMWLDGREQRRRDAESKAWWQEFLWGDAAKEDFSFTDSMRIKRSEPSLNRVSVRPELDIAGLEGEAVAVGDAITSALSVTARPSVDNSSLERTLHLARAIRAAMSGLNAMASRLDGDVDAQLRRSFSD